MMSFAGRIKSCSILAEHFLKSQAFNFNNNIIYTRTLVTNSVLFSRNLLKRIHPPAYSNPLETSKNLGEIIDLDVEFDEVKIDNETIEKKRKIKKKNSKLINNVVDSTVIKAEVNDNIHTLEENNVVESSKTSVKKIKLDDSSRNSRILSKFIVNLRSSKLRKKNDQIILEGKRLIHDAISAGLSPSHVFYSRSSDLEKLSLPENTSLYKLPYKNLTLWSDVVTPQGILAVFKMPKLGELKIDADTIPLTIICDNIRDPGNLGSILRIAASVGCEKLLLTKGCVDIWESKVLRAGAGAHFRLPIISNLQWSEVKNEIGEESKVILADFSDHFVNNVDSEIKDDPVNTTSNFKSKNDISENLPSHCYYSVDYGKENAVIIVGGETHGISNEAYEFGIERKGIRVYIPMSNNTESLNSSVALGILTYEFRRQFDFISGKGIPLQEIGSDNSKNKAC